MSDITDWLSESFAARDGTRQILGKLLGSGSDIVIKQIWRRHNLVIMIFNNCNPRFLAYDSVRYTHIYLWKCVLLMLSCSRSACDWMTGRKRSHSDSIQLTDKWGADGDNVAIRHYYCVIRGSCIGMDYEFTSYTRASITKHKWMQGKACR